MYVRQKFLPVSQRRLCTCRHPLDPRLHAVTAPRRARTHHSGSPVLAIQYSYSPTESLAPLTHPACQKFIKYGPPSASTSFDYHRSLRRIFTGLHSPKQEFRKIRSMTTLPHEIIVVPDAGEPSHDELRQQCYDVRIDVFVHEQKFSLEEEIDRCVLP